MPARERRRAAVSLLVALLACCCCGRAAAQSPVSDEEFTRFVEQAAECADRPVPSLLFVAGSVETRLGSLQVEAKWLASDERRLDDITVCTNSNFERLHMLEAQCQSWGGPVSAAIWLPLEIFNQSNSVRVEEAIRELDDLHARIEQSGACQLDMVLVSELLRPGQAWSYPYNSLRNQAIARTRTKLLVLLDVDFLLRRGLRDHLLQPESYQALLHDTYTHKDVVVLPAFETKPGLPLDVGLEIALKAFRSPKRTIKYMHKHGNLTQFAPFYKRGHTATDYKAWFASDRPYPIAYVAGFEPFVLMSRVHVPWYDERFRGYGWDKITHIFQMDRMGYNLVVHPHGFVVHRPHLPSAGYNKTFTGPAYSRGHKPTKNMRQLNEIAKGMMSDVRKGRYPLYGVTALAGCRRLDVFTKQAVEEQPAGAAAAAAAATGPGQAPLTTAQLDKLRTEDPIAGWW